LLLYFYYIIIQTSLESDTTNDDFVENVVDEPQVTLQSLLNGTQPENIIEIWRIRCIGGLSKHENLVVLLADGTHLCTCMETITKGIICRHFWRVMLYSNSAKFHISIIPARWYKDYITNLDCNFENSPILSAIESANTLIPSASSLTFQNLHHFQGIEYNEITCQNNSQQNRFGVAFSTAKTAVNIALETKTDGELIRLLKDFIAAKYEKQPESSDTNNNLEGSLEQDASDVIVPLQQNLIDQITNPNVTKICEAPTKKRLKSAMEFSKRKVPVLMQENLNKPNNQGERSQRKCLLCGKPGHYQKKCPSAKEGDQYRGIILFIQMWNYYWSLYRSTIFI